MATTNPPHSTVDDLDTLSPPAGPITRKVALATLAELYASLPTVACKGLCHDACTVVAASQLERDVLALHDITLSDKSPRLVIEQARANPDGKIGESCPALNAFGRCSVYADRPFICRAFGVVSDPSVTETERFEQAMMCDHGCEPDATISVQEFMGLMSQIEILSRLVTGVARQPVAGDSPRLMGMFRRDHITERPGFEVSPFLPQQHVTEPVGPADLGARMRAEFMRKATAVPRVDREELALLLAAEPGGRRPARKRGKRRKKR